MFDAENSSAIQLNLYGRALNLYDRLVVLGAYFLKLPDIVIVFEHGAIC